MVIQNNKFERILNLLKYFFLKITHKLEDGILSLRNKIIKLLKKFKIFNGLNIQKIVFFKDLLLKKIKIIFILIIAVIIIACYFAFNKNYYHTLLFYPDKTKNLLLAEKREITKERDNTKRIKNIIEELLLGPINSEIYNVFPKDSKLLSIRLEDDVLFLNLNKETIMNIENVAGDNNPMYLLILKSIVNSVCFQEEYIKLIKFYFNGKEYKYLGTSKPIIEGIKPDWNVLK